MGLGRVTWVYCTIDFLVYREGGTARGRCYTLSEFTSWDDCCGMIMLVFGVGFSELGLGFW